MSILFPLPEKRLHGRPSPVTRPLLESLESRLHLSATVKQFTLANPATLPQGIVADSAGQIWFADNQGAVGRLNADGTVTEFNTPILPGQSASDPTSMVLGPDGDIWYADASQDAVLHFTPNDTPGAATLVFGNAIVTPTKQSQVFNLAFDSSGNLYIVETGFSNNMSGRIDVVTNPQTGFTPTAPQTTDAPISQGNFTEYNVPNPSSQPYAIKLAPNGKLYFTENGNSALGVFDPTQINSANGPITNLALSNSSEMTDQLAIAANGTIWATDFANNLLHIDATGAIIATYALTGFGYKPLIAADGNIYVTIADASQIDAVNPVQNIVTDAVDLPANSSPQQAAFGPDGTLYVSEIGIPAIAAITGYSAVAGPTDSIAGSSLNISEYAGAPFSATVATFTDATNPTASAAHFQAVVSWGDGTTSPATIQADAKVAGQFDVIAPHQYQTTGNDSISVLVQNADGSNGAALTGGTATVTNAPITNATVQNVNGTEGVTFTGQVATFTDANLLLTPSNFTASINWGDTHVSAGTVTSTGAGAFAISGTNTYAQEGSYNVTVNVSDGRGETASATGVASVVDAPLTGTGKVVKLSALKLFLGVIATFKDGNPAAPASDFSTTINWGDGSSSLGLVIKNSDGSFSVLGIHFYKKKLTYNVTVAVADAGGANTRINSTITA